MISSCAREPAVHEGASSIGTRSATSCPETVTRSCSPAITRRRTEETSLRSSRWGIRFTPRNVAELLRSGFRGQVTAPWAARASAARRSGLAPARDLQQSGSVAGAICRALRTGRRRFAGDRAARRAPGGRRRSRGEHRPSGPDRGDRPAPSGARAGRGAVIVDRDGLWADLHQRRRAIRARARRSYRRQMNEAAQAIAELTA